MARTIWIMAGEESGDGYGARLARELQRLSPGIVLRGMGGRSMAAAGVELLVDSSELGFVGFFEVLRHLRFFAGLLRRFTERAAAERPAAVVLIDYPGFNLRLAKRLHGLGVAVVYYVSPQVWAWKRRRRHRLAEWCRRLLCIFPFEPQCYADTGLDVRFVGHPLLEILAAERDPSLQRDPDLVLLLPGSRSGELMRLLPELVRTARRLHASHPSWRFVMPLARPANEVLARRMLADMPAAEVPEIHVEVGRTRHWMQVAAAGIAASGTVTMEAAILGLPLVSVYRLHRLTYPLARLLVRGVSHFTIVNLVAGEELFEEFLQDQVKADRLLPALERIMPGGSRRERVLNDMATAVATLCGPANVSATAAAQVLEVAAAEKAWRQPATRCRDAGTPAGL